MRKPHRSNDAIRMGLAAALLSAVALPAAALDIESAADAAETMMKLRCSLDPKEARCSSSMPNRARRRWR